MCDVPPVLMSEHLQPYGVEHPPILAQVYQIINSQPLLFSNPKRGLTVCENDLTRIVAQLSCLRKHLCEWAIFEFST